MKAHNNRLQDTFNYIFRANYISTTIHTYHYLRILRVQFTKHSIYYQVEHFLHLILFRIGRDEHDKLL